jgi:hypothetical protein
MFLHAMSIKEPGFILVSTSQPKYVYGDVANNLQHGV